MTNETTASERERFEAWALNVGWHNRDLIRAHSGDYREWGTQKAWQGWNARAALPAPADQVLVPKRLTRAMREVLEEEGWTWEDLLAAAEAITEAEYAELQAAPADQPPSQEPQGPSGSLSESSVEAGPQDAASAFERRQRDAFSKIHPINDEVPGALREAFFELFRQGWAGASDYYGIVVDGFGPPDKRGYIERIRPSEGAAVVSAQKDGGAN